MEMWFTLSALLVFVFLFDDLFIDLVSLIYKLGPEHDFNFRQAKGANKTLAIMVANWKEYDVIEAMVQANVGLLKNGKTHLFLGVYPNDHKTRAIVEKLSANFAFVHCVVNRKDGPTYKGQMLDEIIEEILIYEKSKDFRFDGLVLHDSEDLIDTQSLSLYRNYLSDYDFIQTPVLSFPLGRSDFVGATYLDEFAESHSKDMLVREKLKAAIPSAGVGTCMKRNLVMFFRELQGGKLFPHKDLTEDYVLGLKANQFGFQSKFACVMSPEKELVATREFFPNGIRSSIRQKSRWTLGIAFQGWQRLGWFGSISQRYFLWRDRKAIVAPLNTVNCFALFVSQIIWTIPVSESLKIILFTNLAFICLRLLMRSFWIHFHYGFKESCLVFIRWPLAIFINTSAGLVAYKDFVQQTFFGTEVKWKKTQHRFINHPVPINHKKVGS